MNLWLSASRQPRNNFPKGFEAFGNIFIRMLRLASFEWSPTHLKKMIVGVKNSFSLLAFLQGSADVDASITDVKVFD